MTARPHPADSPPLWLIAPFFLVAPFGLIAGGLLLLGSGHDSLVAINLPRTVAVTHAVVIGWIATTIMGAVYQLGPVVIGGKLWSHNLARVQLVIHVASVTTFVLALRSWETHLMAMAGIALVASFVLFAANAVVALARARGRSITRNYLVVAMAFLAITFSLGLTYAMSLHHVWFPITLGRLSAHAHLGLVGFIGLTVMGVSYQLIPMFTVVQHANQRFGRTALIVTTLSLAVFSTVVGLGAGPWLRLAAAVAMAVGPLLWAFDQVVLLGHRGKRKLDVQGRATYVSLVFLLASIILGLGVAWGSPFMTADESARWPLAYAAAGIGGWAGLALIGNSYKILPFLIWFHRYLPRVGSGPVVVTGDIYDERAANAVLVIQSCAAAVLIAGALSGVVALIQAGGVLLVLAGIGHELTLLHMFLPKSAGRTTAAAGTRLIPS